MKKSYYLLLLFTSIICFSQSDKPNEDRILYEKGMALNELYYNSNFFELTVITKDENVSKIVKLISIQALEYFDKLVNDFPESDLFIVSLYEKSMLELDLEQNKKAKESLLTLLNKKNSTQNYYRNKSFIELAKLYIEEKNYKKALLYLEERIENGFHFSCGVELNTTLKRIESLKSTCVEGLKEKK
ncbi:MAG: outer membrane protein assembly factor BamD (BamD/ComL family) [Flavobacterium sp.]|jgi:outer membrane protein assembly factor BamD (BamD/ComL family)